MRLTSKIIDNLPSVKKYPDGVGIEIETELKSGFEVSWKSPFWALKGDGSLRGNGYEFVLKTPIAVENVHKVVEEWATNLKGHKNSCLPSERTSIHVHKNVQHFTVLETLNAICCYWLLEPWLINFCGNSRKGNNFCLTLKDADDIHSQLINGIKTGKTFSNITENNYRYSSLNIAAINRFGTLENRLMRGTDNVEEIENWTVGFSSIVDNARKFKNPSDIIEQFDKKGPKHILETLLDDKLIKYFNRFNKDPDPISLLNENALYVYGISEVKKSWDFLVSKEDLQKDFNKLLQIKRNYLNNLGWVNSPETESLAVTLVSLELRVKGITDFNEFLDAPLKVLSDAEVLAPRRNEIILDGPDIEQDEDLEFLEDDDPEFAPLEEEEEDNF